MRKEWIITILLSSALLTVTGYCWQTKWFQHFFEDVKLPVTNQQPTSQVVYKTMDATGNVTISQMPKNTMSVAVTYNSQNLNTINLNTISATKSPQTSQKTNTNLLKYNLQAEQAAIAAQIAEYKAIELEHAVNN